MKENVPHYWQRAHQALRTARLVLPHDPEAAASRAYYAARAVDAAERILDAVRATHPEAFGEPE